jgi:hypothetical protein
MVNLSGAGMAEINGNKNEVEAFLREWFVKDTSEVQIPKQRASDYAEIAVFLSDPDRWKPAVEEVSKLLREHYLAALLIRRTNGFTSAISMIAPLLGFPETRYHLLLAGFTDPNTFKSYVRNGFFWKDAVSSYHGEHSHSIQWLALAQACKDKTLNINADISTLYKESVDYACKKPLYHASSKEDRLLLLWDWLVDCFDYGPSADFEANITSQTARSPTYLNKSLFNEGEKVGSSSWLGQYLVARHNKRLWPLPTQASTNLKEHAIERAGVRGHIRIASNSGGNHVYQVDNKKVGNGSRLNRVRAEGVESVTLRMTKSWATSFSLRTSLGITLAVNDLIAPTDEEFKLLKGQFDVKVQIAEKKDGSGYEAAITGWDNSTGATFLPQ